MVLKNPHNTVESAKSSLDISSFVKKLSGYYCQFLETDFKRSREPKRKFLNRDRSNRKIGIRASKYPKFLSLLHKKINEPKPTSFSITPRQYKSNLSLVTQEAISAAIDTVDMTPLEANFTALHEEVSKQLSLKNIDIEKVLESVSEKTRRIVDAYIVSPVLDVVAPIFEKQGTASIALDQLISYSEEISTLLTRSAEESFPTTLADLCFRQNGEPLENIFKELQNANTYKAILKEYFSDFVAADIFTEFRELISTHQLSENTQFYVNIGEIRNSKSIFPIYSLPISILVEEGKINISFEPHLYAHKKVIDYVVGQISKEQGLKGTNPITDRIFYKQDSENYVELANKTFHDILIALRIEGDVLLSEKTKLSGKGATGVVVNNELSISLTDKSDESIVNDYEALMTGLEGGSQLLSVFSNIIDNFLTSNPISIDNEIDDEWVDTKVPERLVFQSPLPLAEEQRKILSAIRNKQSKFISVEGPPGTGKSHTIAAIAFEMILKEKNILILSDKKEALDVVESKINEVLEKVRGSETSFVNPILRLGKTGSNYSNIIKSTSINKLKIAQRTFKEHRQSFIDDFNNTEKQLNNDINETISAGFNIELEDITRFYSDESQFLESNPHIENFYFNAERDLEILLKMQKRVQDNREFFSSIFANEPLEKLSQFLELSSVIKEAKQSTVDLLGLYPNFDIEKTKNLTKLVLDVENARGMFGYLFSGKQVSYLSNKIAEITGKSHLKPQEKLSELTALCCVKEDLESLLKQYGKDSSELNLLQEILASGVQLTKATEKVIAHYLDLDNKLILEAKIPYTINDLLQTDGELASLLNNLNDLKSTEKVLKDCFDEIPNFDYLQNKTYFESLNSQLLANTIDERVTNFATNKKTDAKVLAKIISSKGKFPTDKFDILKEAFPCIIAGLRDFAEFIPLEPDLFDLVIIDEASQVSIAQALPAILRAKKMIVMGDRKQYSNVKTTNASKELNQGYFENVRQEFEKSVAQDNIDLMTRFGSFDITNSVMDFFEMISNFSIQLRKHFRGYPEMIGFSSEYFYDEYLQVLKIRGKPIEEVLQFIEVDDFDRLETTKNANLQEAEIIIEELTKLLDLEEPPSVGIITPFSAQQKFLSNLINEHEDAVLFQKKLKLAIFTFDTCQGEERDIIMYSMVASRQADALNYIFPLNIRGVPEDEIDGKIRFQRLNVGFSRGKEKLMFFLSKPLEEFKGSIGQALRHYKGVFDKVRDAPTEDDVDDSSPMEKKLLNWIKSTSFYLAYINKIEIIPQFPIGQYLKNIDPNYAHPGYKVDFLVRINFEPDVYQFIVEYDGFAYHFTDKDKVNSFNWKAYLTPEDVERECILESYGYKMLRVNRFNLGSNPVSTLDERLQDLVEEYLNLNTAGESISRLQSQVNENLDGLKKKTRRECRTCKKIKPIQDFFDSNLISKYGFVCNVCKGPDYKTHKKRQDTNSRRCSKCKQVKPKIEFYDEGLKSKYGLMCTTCKGPDYAENRRRNNIYWASRRRY